MKYMLIHAIDPAAGHSAEGVPAFDSWLAEMLARGVTLHGDRLRSVDDATTVQVRDREILVSDGPFAETKEQIAGYDVIDCADLDEAIEIAAKHPTAWMGTIEVRPILSVQCGIPEEGG
ncbi:MAG TPA: YciI family protein [Streptosporangiaceae bacterium]|nr:YciI family protein [Streptosporangiaceae bacterium]